MILAGGFGYFLFVFRYGLLNYHIGEFSVPVQKEYKSWKEIFNNGKEMDFFSFKSGYAVARPGARPYLNLKSLPSTYNIDTGETSPIYFYCIRHPEQGNILFDAGLDRSFHDNPPAGSLHLMLRMYQDKTKTFYKLDEGQDSGSYLKEYGINPGMVLMTHLHPDHACGLLELNDSVKVVFGKKENSFYYKAIAGKYLLGKKLFTLDFNRGTAIYPFSKTIDVFGDGSVWAISTPGHTADHISYILNIKNKPVFLAGDLSVSKDYLMNDIESSCDNGDKSVKQLRKSLEELKEFKKMYPEVKICFSHSDENY